MAWSHVMKQCRVLPLLLGFAVCMGGAAVVDAQSAEPFVPHIGGLGFGSVQLGSEGQNEVALSSGYANFDIMIGLSRSDADIRLSGVLAVDAGGRTDFSLSECSIEVRATDNFVAKAGKFTYHPGSALFFSNIDYFTGPDPVAMLLKGGSAVENGQDLAQFKLIGTSWFAALTASPFRQADALMDPASPWFPRRDLMSRFSILGMTYQLRNVTWAPEAETLPGLVLDPAVALEAGLTLSFLDIRAIGYMGGDRRYAVIGDITMPLTPWGVYDISLTPIHGPVWSLGGAATLQLDPVNLWLDASGSWGRAVGINSLSSANSGWRTGQGTVDSLDLTVGGSWNLPFAGAYLAIEWKYAWYFNGPEVMTGILLSRVVGALFSFQVFDGLLDGTVLALVSLDDGSLGVVPSARVSLWGDNFLSLAFPWFSGMKNTELGQFASVRQVIISLETQF